MVSPANGWYAGKIVAADGTASYADRVTLNVPVDAGYRVYVYYRPTSGDPWAIYGFSAGTVDVTAAGFDAITVTAPVGTTSHAQGDAACRSTWTTNAAVASGEFSLWVGEHRQRLVRRQDRRRRRHRQLRRHASTLNVPADTGYRVYVYYRPTSGDPWSIYGFSAGTVDVTAAGFNAITVTAPVGTHEPRPGQQPAGRRGRPTPPSPAVSSASGS